MHFFCKQRETNRAPQLGAPLPLRMARCDAATARRIAERWAASMGVRWSEPVHQVYVQGRRGPCWLLECSASGALHREILTIDDSNGQVIARRAIPQRG
jgi:hypothetical protein